MRPAFTVAFGLMALTACPVSTGDDSGTTGDDSGGGGTDFSVADEAYTCDAAETGLTSVLTATPGGTGQIDVEHADFSDGCCPTFEAAAAGADGTIDVTYSLTDDMCDCICSLSLTYSITGVAAGAWTVNAGGDSAAVTVE